MPGKNILTTRVDAIEEDVTALKVTQAGEAEKLKGVSVDVEKLMAAIYGTEEEAGIKSAADKGKMAWSIMVKAFAIVGGALLLALVGFLISGGFRS